MTSQDNTLKMPRENPYRLNQIYFYLTAECNLRCCHCWVSPRHVSKDAFGPRTFLSPDLFDNILEQAIPLGLTSVKLTGGEPLLHPDIFEILKIIRRHDLKMTMETNGVLLSSEIAREILRCKSPFVSVSLDGADARTHEGIRGVEGSFDATLDGIRNLVAAGLKPQIIMTLMRRNREAMAPLVELAQSMGAESVKFNLLQPTSRGEGLHEKGEALEIGDLIDLGRRVETELAPKASLRLIYDCPTAFRPLGRILGKNGGGCGTCGIKSILGVLGDGSYALCGIGESIPELVFGHGTTSRLDDIWNHHPTLQSIRKGLPDRLEGMCRDCLMKKRCLGTCVAQNYYRTGSFWSPYWFCDEARKQGLFPDSRLRPDPLVDTQGKDAGTGKSVVSGL